MSEKQKQLEEELIAFAYLEAKLESLRDDSLDVRMPGFRCACNVAIRPLRTKISVCIGQLLELTGKRPCFRVGMNGLEIYYEE